ncbi:MAG: Sjogren's syndrome/scleroderma autoantigen 1 family protein [Promethearchaeia archaeon]
MANLLRSGYKMLNIACPICNSPIFKNKEGKKFCPVCEREVILKDKGNEEFVNQKSSVSDQNQIKAKDKKREETTRSNLKPEKKLDNGEDLKPVLDILLNKINWIGKKIENESQMDSIRSYSKTISKLFNLYLELKKGTD